MIASRFRIFFLSTPRGTLLSSFKYEMLNNHRFQYLLYALCILVLICVVTLFMGHYFQLFFLCGVSVLAIYCVVFTIKNLESGSEGNILEYTLFGKENGKGSTEKEGQSGKVNDSGKQNSGKQNSGKQNSGKQNSGKQNKSGLSGAKQKYIKSIENMFKYNDKATDMRNDFMDTLRESKSVVDISFEKFKELYKEFDQQNERIKDELLAVDVSITAYDYELEKLEKALRKRYFLVQDEDSELQNEKSQNLKINDGEIKDEEKKDEEQKDEEQKDAGLSSKSNSKGEEVDKNKSPNETKGQCQQALTNNQKNPHNAFEVNAKKLIDTNNMEKKHKKTNNDFRNKIAFKTKDLNTEKSIEKHKINNESAELKDLLDSKKKFDELKAKQREQIKFEKLHGLIASFTREKTSSTPLFDQKKLSIEKPLRLRTSNKLDDLGPFAESNNISHNSVISGFFSMLRHFNPYSLLTESKSDSSGTQNQSLNDPEKTEKDDFKQPNDIMVKIQFLFLMEGLFTLIVVLLLFTDIILLGTLVRLLFLILMVVNIFISLLLMIEAQTLEQKCNNGDLISCKSPKQIATEGILFKLNKFMKMPKNSTNIKTVKKKFAEIADKHKQDNKKLNNYITVLTDTEIIKSIGTFDYLFKKLSFIEKDFEDIMSHKVTSGEYFVLVKRMKILLDKIETKIDDVDTKEVMKLYETNTKINMMYINQKNNLDDTLQNFMSDDAKTVARSNGDKCKKNTEKMCALGGKYDQLYFVILVGSIILIILLCF